MDVALCFRGVVGAAGLDGRTSAEGLLRLAGTSEAVSAAGRGRFLAGGVRSSLAERSFLKASRRDLDGSDRMAWTRAFSGFLYFSTTILDRTFESPGRILGPARGFVVFVPLVTAVATSEIGMALGGGFRARSSSTIGGRVGESKGGISDFGRFGGLLDGGSFALIFSCSFFVELSRSSSNPMWIGDSRSGIAGLFALLFRECPGGITPLRGGFPAGFFLGLGTPSPTSIWNGGDRRGGIFGLGTSGRSPLRGVDVELPARDHAPLTIIVDLGDDKSLSFSLDTCSRPFAACEGVDAFASIVPLGAGLSFGTSRLRCVLDLESPARSGLDVVSSALGFFCGGLFSSASGGRFRVSCVVGFFASLLDGNAVLHGSQG